MPIPSFIRRLSVSSSSRRLDAGDTAEEYVVNVRRLVTQSKWNRLRALLATGEGRNAARRSFAFSPNMHNSTDDRSILHDLMANDAPHDIVETIFATLGIAPLQQHLTNVDPNNYHRTPFHEAIQNDVSCATIQLMVTVCPAVVTIADDRGITPLMIECSKGRYCDYDTVKLLVRSAPQHVMDEANDGSTALECALMSGAVDIFRRLQRFHAQELRKESQEEMERRRMMAAVSEVDATVPTPSLEDTKKLVEGFSNIARRHSSACSRHAGRHSSSRSQRISRSSAAA